MFQNKSHKSINKPNRGVQHVILGFHRKVAENCALLGYYSARSGSFGTTYQSHPQVSFFLFLNPKDGTNKLSQNGNKLPLLIV